VNSKIYSEVKGNGHNIVLIHGWGMHGGLWGKFNKLLSLDCRTHAIDLPGFGYSKNIKNEFTLDAITEVIEEYIKELNKPVTLIGWSLGGLISLNILKRKNVDLDKIIFIATTPRFTKKKGWECAMEQSVFNDFSKDLKIDYKKTLKRFLSLQTRGSDLAREDLRELNQKLNERGDPDIKALESGLNILSNTDLRNERQNNISAMIVLGEKDTLVPLSVKGEFEKTFPNIEQLVLEKTGHAPFISNPEICAEKIKNFINE
jgi:pimeloyl-[acyl-carrier protein] methyl ester esterase